MKRKHKLLSLILAISMVLIMLPSFAASAADLQLSYEMQGNTAAVITAESGTITSVSVDDESIATAELADGFVTVTGADGAVGIVTVTINETQTVEVPIGYTTFIFDGDEVTVYSGSSTKYEIYGICASDGEDHEISSTDNADGSVTYYSEDDSVKLNINVKKAGGTYVFSGTASDASVSVNKAATGDAILLLAGVDISSSITSPITVKKESTATVTITALAGTVNTLQDAEFNNADTYGATDDGGNGENAEYAESAVIKGKSYANITLNGTGTLNLICNSKNAVKVGEYGALTIEDITLNVTSAGHGISSDNILTINSGTITVTAESDGIRSDPDAVDADAGCAGNIIINGGTITITAGSDGIQAAQDVTITDGSFNIKTGSGYNDSSFDKDTMSCKGIKASFNSDDDTAEATNTITISGGTFSLNTADDSVHSDGYIVITGGSFDIYTGDDGVHADTSLTLGEENGDDSALTINVNTSYEGLEAGTVYIYSGNYNVIASDDGINSAGDSSDSQFNPGGQPGGFSAQGFGGGNQPGGGQPGGEQPGGGMSGGNTESNTGYDLYIYGGNVYVNAAGDGLDSNGNIYLTGGTIVVWGAAANSDNEPLDCDGLLYINGATVFAAGSSQMMTTPSTTSQSYVTSKSTFSNGSTIYVNNSSGTVYSAKAIKNVNYVLYSSPSVTSSGWSIDSGSGATSTVSGSWQKINGTWYYKQTNGSYATGWAKISGKWYYFNSNGAMQTGWVKTSGKWYYLSSSGAMVTGWSKINNVWYYFNSSGAMQTGWLKDGGSWYYLKSSGAMATGWIKDGGTWYYLNGSGAMVTGWRQISNVWYYFNSSGAMVTGTQTINGKTYTFASSGAWVS